VDFASYMTDDVLVKVDRASMLTSLEVRAPFLDPAVMEFAFSRVPDDLRATEHARKVILRRLGERLLPPSLDLTRKQGFSIPVDAWMRGPWNRLLIDVTADSRTSLVSGSALTAYSSMLRNGHAVGERLFSLLVLRLWERHYQISDII
jgi:asparagine synthase (glutamine-hydrolysing)